MLPSGVYLALLCSCTLSLCKLLAAAAVEQHHEQCYRQQPVNSSTRHLIPDELVPADCSSSGHWPLKKSCKSSKSGIYFDPNTQSLFSAGCGSGSSGNTKGGNHHHLHHATFVHETWNISSEAKSSPLCAAFIPQAIFMPIAYDEVAYQTEGSNYYVTHMDSLLPLWNVLKKRQKATPHSRLPEIFLFAFNVEGKIDLSTRAFDDFSKYWIQSLQLLLGDVQVQLGTMDAMSQYLMHAMHDGSGRGSGVGSGQWGSGTEGEGGGGGEGGETPGSSGFDDAHHHLMAQRGDARDRYNGSKRDGSRSRSSSSSGALCFGEVLFGVPQFNPTRRGVRSFSQDFRRVSKQSIA